MSPAEDDLYDLLHRVQALSASSSDDSDPLGLEKLKGTLEILAAMLPAYKRFIKLLEILHDADAG